MMNTDVSCDTKNLAQQGDDYDSTSWEHRSDEPVTLACLPEKESAAAAKLRALLRYNIPLVVPRNLASTRVLRVTDESTCSPQNSIRRVRKGRLLTRD
jgi:hypothetical protein